MLQCQCSVNKQQNYVLLNEHELNYAESTILPASVSHQHFTHYTKVNAVQYIQMLYDNVLRSYYLIPF